MSPSARQAASDFGCEPSRPFKLDQPYDHCFNLASDVLRERERIVRSSSKTGSTHISIKITV